MNDVPPTAAADRVAAATATPAPAVAVLMPVRDGAATVGAAIASVLAQTHEDLELIVVDDGSRDATAAILRGCQDPRLRVLRNATNLGIPRALQRGLDAARAPLLARLDADDRWEPGYLRSQCAALAAAPAATLVACWTREVDDGGNVVGAAEPPAAPGFAAWELTHRNALYPSATVVRREAVTAVGGFALEFAVAEDHELWTRLLMAGARVVVHPEPLVLYRRSAAGATGSTPRDVQRRLGLAVRRRYLGWMLDREVADEAVSDLWDLLGWRSLPDELAGERLARAIGLTRDVAAACAARFELPRATERAIARRTAAHLLHHVAARARRSPGDAARLWWAGVRWDPAALRGRRPWRLGLGVARCLARSRRGEPVAY